MFGVVKPVMRVAVVGGLGLGAAVLIAGPHRVAALAEAAQGRIVSVIDSKIDDPTVLRAQLRELAEKYPQRIGEVRGDLSELQEQMRQIERDRTVAERVVALADKDLGDLKVMLAKGEEARATAGPGRVVTIAFADRDVKLEDAYGRATQIAQTKTAYQARSSEAERTLVYLQQQESRLKETLGKLESEQAEFTTQLWQIDHQVDAIARNDRLLEMLERRQKQIDSYNRFDVVSVDQVKQRLAQVQSKQEAQFKSLEKQAERLNYEDQAKREIDAEHAAKGEFERATKAIEGAPKAEPAIRVKPSSPSPLAPRASTDPMASSGGVRVY